MPLSLTFGRDPSSLRHVACKLFVLRLIREKPLGDGDRIFKPLRGGSDDSYDPYDDVDVFIGEEAKPFRKYLADLPDEENEEEELNEDEDAEVIPLHFSHRSTTFFGGGKPTETETAKRLRSEFEAITKDGTHKKRALGPQSAQIVQEADEKRSLSLSSSSTDSSDSDMKDKRAPWLLGKGLRVEDDSTKSSELSPEREATKTQR
jgi:hypothetical protein